MQEEEERKVSKISLLGRRRRKSCFISFDLSSRADLAKENQCSTRSL